MFPLSNNWCGNPAKAFRLGYWYPRGLPLSISNHFPTFKNHACSSLTQTKKLKNLFQSEKENTHTKNMGKFNLSFWKNVPKIDFGNMDNGSGVEINDGSKPLTRFEICQFQCQIANFTENRVWPALNCRWWSKSDQNSSEWRLKRHKLHLTVRTQPQMANGIIWGSGMISIFSNFSSYCIEKFGNPFVCIFSPEPSSRSIQWYLTMRLNLICRIFFPQSIFW